MVSHCGYILSLSLLTRRWNEALHGVARDGVATSFPQIIGVASSYNKTLWHSMADVISTEGNPSNPNDPYHNFYYYKPSSTAIRIP